MNLLETHPNGLAKSILGFASLLSNRFWMKAVTLIGPARAGFFTHLLPLFGVLLAIALLGEPFHAYHLAGAVLIFGGIILVNR